MDARAPITTQNKRFLVSSPAPRIALYNKLDLSDLTVTEKEILIERQFQLGASAVLFGSASDSKSELIKHDIIDEIMNAVGRNRNPIDGSIEIQIVGMPNVGKSTLLNSLRTTHSSEESIFPAGNKPGVTKAWILKFSMS